MRDTLQALEWLLISALIVFAAIERFLYEDYLHAIWILGVVLMLLQFKVLRQREK